MSITINRSELKYEKSQDFEVIMPDGTIEKYTLKEPYITEEIIQRWANNKFAEWRLEKAKEYEEIHYGVFIRRYRYGKVVEEAWVRNIDNAVMFVKEGIAHSAQCDVSELGDYNIEYFGFFPRIYIAGFGDEDYYQFERGDFNEEGYVKENV